MNDSHSQHHARTSLHPLKTPWHLRILCNKSTSIILLRLCYSTSAASIKSGCYDFITQISSRPTRVIFQIVGFILHPSSKHKVVQAGPLMREASLYCRRFVHIIKPLTAKTMQSHASDVSRDPAAFPTDRRFRLSICHSPTFSHKSQGLASS